jgi:acyl-CoA reductase-like NAD-dependent aldehyde dehydrogenase
MLKTNPVTEKTSCVDETALPEIAEMVRQAQQVQPPWGAQDPDQRITVIRQLADLIEQHQETIAETITNDMGKVISLSRGEVATTIGFIRYYCDHANEWLAAEPCPGGIVRFDPLGVVAVICPWNAPLALALRPMTTALLAGNAVIVKPSEHSPQTGLTVDWLFRQLRDHGLPENIVQSVVGGKEHGKQLVEQDVALVAFTGSTLAGKDIAASSAEKLHRVLLELGGLDAAIVLKDTNVANTAREIVVKNSALTGQVCNSIKRVYVEKEVYAQFVEAAVAESEQIRYGDPHSDVDMGPLVAEFQVEKVAQIVEDARDKGAQVLTGGKRPEIKGYFYPSTILVDVTCQMRVMREEPFGPVLPIVAIDSWQEAVELSNDTSYGLTGSVWTENTELAQKIAKQLNVGVVGINVHGGGAIGAPWGGTKESGIGRINTKEGFRQFTNTKLVRTS